MKILGKDSNIQKTREKVVKRKRKKPFIQRIPRKKRNLGREEEPSKDLPFYKNILKSKLLRTIIQSKKVDALNGIVGQPGKDPKQIVGNNVHIILKNRPRKEMNGYVLSFEGDDIYKVLIYGEVRTINFGDIEHCRIRPCQESSQYTNLLGREIQFKYCDGRQYVGFVEECKENDIFSIVLDSFKFKFVKLEDLLEIRFLSPRLIHQKVKIIDPNGKEVERLVKNYLPLGVLVFENEDETVEYFSMKEASSIQPDLKDMQICDQEMLTICEGFEFLRKESSS